VRAPAAAGIAGAYVQAAALGWLLVRADLEGPAPVQPQQLLAHLIGLEAVTEEMKSKVQLVQAAITAGGVGECAAPGGRCYSFVQGAACWLRLVCWAAPVVLLQSARVLAWRCSHASSLLHV
jgi:hypothetical protein